MMLKSLLPVIVLLVMIVGRFIKNERYIMVAVIYACCVAIIKNVVYHVYNSIYTAYGAVNIDGYLLCIKIGVVIFAVAAIWKYVIQRIVMRRR